MQFIVKKNINVYFFLAINKGNASILVTDYIILVYIFYNID